MLYEVITGLVVVPVGNHAGVGVSVGDCEAVAVAFCPGDGDGRKRFSAGGGGLPGADEQQTAILDGGDGVELAGQARQEGGI